MVNFVKYGQIWSIMVKYGQLWSGPVQPDVWPKAQLACVAYSITGFTINSVSNGQVITVVNHYIP